MQSIEEIEAICYEAILREAEDYENGEEDDEEEDDDAW